MFVYITAAGVLRMSVTIGRLPEPTKWLIILGNLHARGLGPVHADAWCTKTVATHKKRAI